MYVLHVQVHSLLPERGSHALQKTHRIDYTTSHAVVRVKVINFHDAGMFYLFQHATMWPFPLSVSDGHSCAHFSVAKRHLVRKAHPEGIRSGLGTSPSSMILLELFAILGSGIGTAESRDCV